MGIIMGRCSKMSVTQVHIIPASVVETDSKVVPSERKGKLGEEVVVDYEENTSQPFELSSTDLKEMNRLQEEERLDPSINIGEVEEKIARSRRTSRMESENLAKQKLLLRLKSQSVEKEEEVIAPKSPTMDENLDLSVKSPQEVEDRITKTRRQSHSSYQHKLSLKRENLSKKRSENSESSPSEQKLTDPI